MFRCKECGTEYDIKPDFCDCGNDIFEEIPGTVQKQAPAPSVQNQFQKSVSEPKHKKTFNEQYPEFERLKNSFDPISAVLFLICIIIGLCVIFLVGNPEPDNVSDTDKNKAEVKSETLNIPSIDTFWNNSTAGIINNEKTAAQRAARESSKKETEQNKISAAQQELQKNPMLAKVENTLNSPVVKEPVQTTKPQTNVSQQTKSVQQQKTTQQTKTTSAQQPKTSAASHTSTQKKNNSVSNKIQSIFGGSNSNTSTNKNTSPSIPQKTRSIANQPKTSGTQTSVSKAPKQTQIQLQPKSASNVAKSQTTPAQTTTNQISLRPKATIDTKALQKELNNYKIGLRNTIGKKIDFANVVGDGECAVSFKVASTGKITNRAFSKQSSNITLNDAVYSAVMSTPSYNPPPSGYNNETMTLKIRFYNGNFDISLN